MASLENRLRSITLVSLGVVVAIVGFLFFSGGFGTGASEPAIFTISGALIMLGLVFFFQGVYKRGQESGTGKTS